MFLMTDLARAQQAEIEKRRKKDQEPEKPGRAPLHAMAEGAQEYDEEQRREREALKGRHPETGQFTADRKHPVLVDGHAADSPGNFPATPRPASLWPGSEAHKVTVGGVELMQVGDPTAPLPEPLTTLHDQTVGDHPERCMHPGAVQLAHIDLGGRPDTFGALPTPMQPPFRTAPNSSGGTS